MDGSIELFSLFIEIDGGHGISGNIIPFYHLFISRYSIFDICTTFKELMHWTLKKYVRWCSGGDRLYFSFRRLLPG